MDVFFWHEKSMKKLLVVVDMQNDFVSGSLGTDEAKKIVPKVLDKIQRNQKNDKVVFTRDTHKEDYLQTREGRFLPVEHCIQGTWSHELIDEVKPLAEKIFDKPTFGSMELVHYVTQEEFTEVELIGLCTDICVVTNALLLKTFFPEIEISVDSACCAGVTPESHDAALLTMKMCQIVIHREY